MNAMTAQFDRAQGVITAQRATIGKLCNELAEMAEMKIVLEHSELARKLEHEEEDKRMTMLAKYHAKYHAHVRDRYIANTWLDRSWADEVVLDARDELDEMEKAMEKKEGAMEKKEKARLTELTKQRHLVQVGAPNLLQLMDTWIWENNNIFTSHSWVYYSDIISIKPTPSTQSTDYSVLVDKILDAVPSQAAAGEKRISISEFETCLQDWMKQEKASAKDIRLINMVGQIDPPDGADEADVKMYKKMSEEWDKMLTRVFPENFVPTHGGKPHRRTPSWWEGCSTNTR